jgi:hypothetical protein
MFIRFYGYYVLLSPYTKLIHFSIPIGFKWLKMLMRVQVSKLFFKCAPPFGLKIVPKKCFLAFFLTFARGGNDYAWCNKTLF